MAGAGKAFRRRQKNAEKANVSLHKAASGKGTVHAPLPSAPTKDDYKEKMPASLRKMLALKEVAEQPAKRRKLEPGSATGQQQQAHGQHRRQDGKQGGKSVTQQQQQQQEQQQSHDNSLPDQVVQKQQQQQQQQQNGQNKPSTQQQQQGAQPGAMTGQQPKKLKQKKKEYLNAKKMKKKGQRGKAAADQDMELETERVAFGDVVHAPPEVALKRKHWVTNSKAQQQQQQGGRKATPGSSGKKHTSKQWPPKQQGAEDAELLEARQQLIDSYRAARPAPQEGQATLKTLKDLVKKQSGA